MANAYINYVEPNYNFNKGGKEQQVPLEDLCIAVDLCVEVPPLQFKGQVQQDSTTYLISWTSTDKKTSMSFFNGTKNPTGDDQRLSTNYTKATYEDLKYYATNELFGISSIDIQYENYFTPQITIEFVDVRGASLFGLEEMRHPGINGYVDGDVAGSFFRCFFVQPWPKFTLLVKGFYGQPVTYTLACQSFKAKFDSKTGNFKATTRFIGYTYGFLGDIMLSPLLASVNSPFYGKSYWDAQCANNRFVIDGAPMPKVTDILRKAGCLVSDLNNAIQESPEQQALTNTENDLNNIQPLIGKYNDIVTKYKEQINKVFDKPDILEMGDEYPNTFVLLVEPGFNNLAFINSTLQQQLSSIKGEYDAFLSEWDSVTILKSYEKPILDFELVPYTGLSSTVRTANLCVKLEEYRKKKESENLQSSTFNTPQIINSDGSLYYGTGVNYLGGQVNNTQTMTYRKEMLYVLMSHDNEIWKTVQNDTQTLVENQAVQTAALETKIKEVTTDALGFKPTIYNITKIMMAHMETFIYEISECHNKIYSTSRTNDSIIQTGGGQFCTPFPKVHKLTTNKDSNSQSLELAWIGDVSNNNPEAYERDLIEGLLKGLDELKQAIAEAQGLQSLTDASANNEVAIRPFLPSDVTDFRIWEAVDCNNLQSIGNAILLRAMGVFSTHRKGSTYDSSNAKDIGKADAETFMKLFPQVSTNIGGVIGNLTSSNIISSGVSCNIITEAGSQLQIKGSIIPITHIDTKTTNMINSNGIIQETQHPEYYVKWGDGAEKYKTFDICTGTNAEKFFNNKSLTGVTTSGRVSTGMDGNYSNWYNNGQIGVLIGKNFQPADKIAVDYTPTTSNGLFADTKEKMQIQNDDVFKSENEDKWAQWASDGWGFDQLKTKQGVLKRSGSFTDCLTSYEKFKELIGGYTLTMFNGVNWTDSKNQLQSCVGVSVFTQKLFVSSTNIHFKAYLFLESCISYKLDINGLNYGSSLTNKIKDGWVKTCPYLFVLYIGALKSADYECNNYDYVKNKKNTIFGNTNPVFAEACYKEFKEWVTNYFSSTILGNYKVPKDGGAIEIIGERFKKYDNTKLCSTIASWFEDKFFQHYISFKPANASKNEAVDFTQSKERTYGFRLMVRPNDTSKDIVNNLFQPCVIVQHSSSQGVEKNTTPELVPPGISKSTVQSYIDGFIEVISAASVSNTTTVANNGTDSTTTGDDKTSSTNTTTADGAKNKETKGVKAQLKATTDNTVTATTANTESTTETTADPTATDASATSGSDGTLTVTSTMTSGVEYFEADPLTKASLYDYVKTVYDKWLKGNIGHLAEIGEFAKLEDFFDKHFHFIDTFYNYATDVFIDVHHFCSVVNQSNVQGSYGLINFLSSIYSKGFALYVTQNFMDYNNSELMESMFQPIPYIEMKRPTPTDTHVDFVIVKQNEVSHQLHMLDENGEDMDDSFMLGNNVEDCLLPVPISSKNAAQRPSYLYQDSSFLGKFDTPNHVYKIPCFGVAYGKQYENYFTEIDVSTDNHVATNESLNAEMRILYETKPQFAPEQPENASNTQVQYLSQDLYSVYMNNSYTCTVKMMGCAWVQPLMYFCLTNVPMFRGAYQIISVSHSITPGNMITTFKGVRMAKTSLPHVDKMLVRSINHGGVGYDGSAFDQTTLATIDNDCGYKYFNPFFEGGATAFPNIINEMQATLGSVLAESELPKGGCKKSKVMYGTYANNKIEDILMGIICQEYGSGEDIDREIVAVTLYNRLVATGGTLKQLFRDDIFTYAAYAATMQNQDGSIVNRVDKFRTHSKWGKCKEALYKIFQNGPYCLVGTTVHPKNPFKLPDGTMTTSTVLDEVMLKYVTSFGTDVPVNAKAYKGGGAINQIGKGFNYLFHINGHVFSTTDGYIKRIDKFYSTHTPSSTTSSGEKKELTNKEKLEKIIGAIGQTVSHSTAIGFNQIYHKMSGDNGAYVSTSANHTEDVNNATLFDIIYNTYYKDLDKIEWCTKDANSSGSECRGVYIELNGVAKSIGVRHSKSYIPDTLTEKDGKVTGIMNEKFYKALGKKFRQVNDSNKKAFLEIKNYKDSDINKFNKLIGNYIPQPCPTPSMAGDAGGGGSYDGGVSDYSVLQIPNNLKEYSGNYPYSGSPFTKNKLVQVKNPTQQQLDELTRLVATVLHPLYDKITFYAGSTLDYRKSKKSQHPKGQASDTHGGTASKKNGDDKLNLPIFKTAYNMFIRGQTNNSSPVGQILYETEARSCAQYPEWTHISCYKKGIRCEAKGYNNNNINSEIPYQNYPNTGRKCKLTRCDTKWPMP